MTVLRMQPSVFIKVASQMNAGTFSMI